MPLPFILGVAAAIAATTGVGNGIHGIIKMSDANDTKKETEKRHKRNMENFEAQSKLTNETMDELGILELQILKGFEEFSDTIEKIQNRPQFVEYNKNDFTLPKYDKEVWKDVSVGAGVLLGGLGGAVAGTAGGVAAAGATTSAVMALGTASTGTAIASLSGAAATNATLAALGGGSLAVGGGGIALGTSILGATTLGVGLLVGGIIFNIAGKKLSDKADEAYWQVKKEEETLNKIRVYLIELQETAENYMISLNMVKKKYIENYSYISFVVNNLHKTDWAEFSEREKIATQNTILLVGLLYKMCQVSLVVQAENENEMNAINQLEIDEVIRNSEEVLLYT